MSYDEERIQIVNSSQIITLIEAVSRFVLALSLAFIFWVVLGQVHTCPYCGTRLDIEHPKNPKKVILAQPDSQLP